MKAQEKKSTAKKPPAVKKVDVVNAETESTTDEPKNKYKPDSLLGRRGGMVPTVQLSRHAASRIS